MTNNYSNNQDSQNGTVHNSTIPDNNTPSDPPNLQSDIDNPHKDPSTLHSHRASTEAGIVRGLARSIPKTLRFQMSTLRRSFRLASREGRSSLPWSYWFSRSKVNRTSSRSSLGVLSTPTHTHVHPKPTITPTSRIPVSSKLAKIPDHVAHGLGIHEHSPSEKSAGATTTQQQQIVQSKKEQNRVRPVVTSMMKNMILGAAVFETYCYVVQHWAPPSGSTTFTGINQVALNKDKDKDKDNWNPVPSAPRTSTSLLDDPMTLASPGWHAVAGGIGGAVQGIMVTVWDCLAAMTTTTTPTSTAPHVMVPEPNRMLRFLLHPSTWSHAALFGSYESLKRQWVQMCENTSSTTPTTTSRSSPHIAPMDACQDKSIPTFSLPWNWIQLSSVVVAGGVAGQLHHVTNHYLEHIVRRLRLQNQPTTTGRNLSLLLFGKHGIIPPPPSLKSVIGAFPMSAVGFVVFEYGQVVERTSERGF